MFSGHYNWFPMLKKYIYISLFLISIIGLSIVQFQYFRIGLNLAGHQFNQNIGEAINNIKEGLSTQNELTYLMATVIEKDETNFRLSMDSLKDASSYFLNDYLVSELAAQGIRAEFAYTVRSRDSIVYISSKKQFSEGSDLLAFPLVLTGYLPQKMASPIILEISFQNLNRYFLSQLNGLTIPSLIFILVILFILIWVFRAFYMQRSLITTTNEFINNLTHELRTPVFSLGLATKLLEEKSNKDQKELVGMIRVQLEKLKSQIDKVLELAIIEGKSGVLKKEEFDFHPILERIGSDFRKPLLMEGGKFHAEFNGIPYLINGDSYHLENSISSLLENARKYSGDHLDIKFLGSRIKNNLVVQIIDKGRGIPKSAKTI